MKANTNQNVEQLSSTNIHNLQILLPEAFDFMVTFLIIQSDISLKNLSALTVFFEVIPGSSFIAYWISFSNDFLRASEILSKKPFNLKALVDLIL
jgi:hypothetical protein